MRHITSFMLAFSVEANSRDVGAAVEKLEILSPESCWLKLMKGHLHLLNAELTAAEPLLREGTVTRTLPYVNNLHVMHILQSIFFLH